MSQQHDVVDERAAVVALKAQLDRIEAKLDTLLKLREPSSIFELIFGKTR